MKLLVSHMSEAECGLASIEDAHIPSHFPTMAFWRIMPFVWPPEVWSELPFVMCTGWEGSGCDMIIVMDAEINQRLSISIRLEGGILQM